MVPYERQQKILSILKNVELIKFEELKKEFTNVSDSTLRRDLKELEKNNKIENLSGGAIKILSAVGEIPISTRNTLNNDKKEKIASLAADEIVDGDVIYLDSGSTCSLLFKEIVSKRITIYTTNTDIFALGGNINSDIIILGGLFNPINSSVSGALTEENLKDIYFNKCFLGVNGVSDKFGVTTPTIEEAVKKRLVKNHSDTIYLLCDSTKFHKLSNVKAFNLEGVTIISDENDLKLSEKISIIY